MAPKNKITRNTKTHARENEKKENDDKVNKLIEEISSLKKVIASKERIIDDLASERYHAKDDRDVFHSIMRTYGAATC